MRITAEVNDVFDAKMKMAASSFLYPAAFGLYDAYGSKSVLEPFETHAGSRVRACTMLRAGSIKYLRCSPI